MAGVKICAECGTMVGVLHFQGGFFDPDAMYADIPCRGPDKHPKPERTEKSYFFGLLKWTEIVYPETGDKSTWYTWRGKMLH